MASRGSSRIPGFFNLSRQERLDLVAEHTGMTMDERQALEGGKGLPMDVAENMIENVIGLYSLPLGIATNFIVNDREVLIPMVVEEPSIVAGASFMAKLARPGGGFHADTDPP